MTKFAQVGDYRVYMLAITSLSCSVGHPLRIFAREAGAFYDDVIDRAYHWTRVSEQFCSDCCHR